MDQKHDLRWLLDSIFDGANIAIKVLIVAYLTLSSILMLIAIVVIMKALHIFYMTLVMVALTFLLLIIAEVITRIGERKNGSN